MASSAAVSSASPVSRLRSPRLRDRASLSLSRSFLSLFLSLVEGVALLLPGLRKRMRRSLLLAVVVVLSLLWLGVPSMARVARGKPSIKGGWSRNSIGSGARMRLKEVRLWK